MKVKKVLSVYKRNTKVELMYQLIAACEENKFLHKWNKKLSKEVDRQDSKIESLEPKAFNGKYLKEEA